MDFKVAITTSDGKVINQHFGHCSEFTIVRVNGDTGEWSFVEKRKSSPACREFTHSDEQIDKIAALLSDCLYLLTYRVGTYPLWVLKSHGVTCLEASEPICDYLPRLYLYYKSNLK